MFIFFLTSYKQTRTKNVTTRIAYAPRNLYVYLNADETSGKPFQVHIVESDTRNDVEVMGVVEL